MPIFPRPLEKRADIEKIRLEPRCQCRVGIDKEHVATLVEAYQNERDVPHIQVWEVTAPDQDPRLVVVDGYHRLQALGLIKREFVWLEVVGSGSLDEASLYAVTRNHTHGLRRTAEDRELTIRRVVENPLARDYTNTTIARHTGCNDKLVARVRKEAEAALRAEMSSAEDETPAEPETRPGADGKDYPTSRPHAGGGKGKGKGNGKGKGKGKAAIERTDGPVPDDTPIDESIAELKVLRAVIKKRSREHEWGEGLFGDIAQKLGNCESLLDSSRPTLCPACKGEKCVRCSSRGWVSKERAKIMRAGT
jgi:hypothetical protein